MARSPKLKVFRTPIGFHDAYIAAPSQKAALEAWGSDKDLFSSGAAERVEDPELMREPLANPGKVIRRLRGTMAEHMAALPKDSPPRPATKEQEHTETPSGRKGQARPKRPPKPKPWPDRAALASAEAELADAEARHESERVALAKRQGELDRERRKLELEQAREHDRLDRKVEATREKYDRAMRVWRED